MSKRIFCPEVYIKTGAGITVPATQELLTTALATWTNLYGSENGASIKEEQGSSVTLTGGQTVPTSKSVTGVIKVLEVTPANYTYLRTLRNVLCSIIFNESINSGTISPTGKAFQIQNVYPKVKFEGKSGDLFRVSIGFKKTGSLANVIEEYDLT